MVVKDVYFISCKEAIHLLTSHCLLQIALFYVALLAGLLHRFPVSFSQVQAAFFFFSPFSIVGALKFV